MPSLAIYMPGFASGGVQRMHLAMAPVFMKVGYDVTFVVHERRGALADAVPAGAGVVSLGARRALGAIRPLAAYLKRERPDIVLANMGHPNMIALAANKLAGKPSRIIASQHNHLSSQSAAEPGWQHKILPFLYRRFLRHADAIAATSKGVADDMAAVSGVPRDRITVIYNPAVPEGVAERAAEPVDHPWFTDGGPVAIAIGRLVPMKDYPTLLDAIARLPAVRLMILGEGPLLGELSEQAERLGIAERVHFLGFRDNPFAYLARASLFVLSSRYEGFGLVVAEALACGTPVVSTDCRSGPAEILDDGRYGRLVPVGDSQALADAIAATLTAPVDRAALIERSRVFTVDVAAANYQRLYEQVLVGA